MTMLLVSLLAFVGTHFLMSHPLRAGMVAKLGTSGFLGLYSVVSLLTFGWIIWAFRAAPVEAPLWAVGDGLWAFASILMAFGAILFAGSHKGNPAMPNPDAAKASAQAASQPARGVFAITRHPMMWGFAIWAIVHALVSPQPKVLALTAAMLILALGGSYGQDIKKAKLLGDGWKGWSARTSFMPFGNQLSGKAGWGSAWVGRTPFLAGVAFWLIACYLHPMLGGPVAGIWRWLVV